MAKLHDRVPLVTREGTEVQIKEALAPKPGAILRVENIVDDSIVRELDKDGFIDQDLSVSASYSNCNWSRLWSHAYY